MDGLKTFEVESWSLLEVQTLIETAKCYQQLNDHERLARTCAQLACAPCLLTSEEKLRYCVEMADTVDLLGKYVLVIRFSPLIIRDFFLVHFFKI